jgi:large subunit ribosomal protein L9
MPNTKLLLQETIKNVGRVGDIVEVSPGYARNFLIPRGLAVQPTPNNIKKVEARRKEIERQERERREQQERMIKQLATVEVHLERRANEQGHLFGSVTATDVAKALQAQGFNIEAADINLPGRLDRISNYTVNVKFAEDLATDIKVWVNADPESKALIDEARKTQEAAAAAAAPAAENA